MSLWDYLSEAWSLLWSKRSLWLFGLLAALGGSGFNFIWHIGETQPLTELPLGSRALLQNVLNPLDPPRLILVGVVLGGAMFVLNTLAQGALIRMVGLWLRHQEVTLRDGLRAAWHYFLPLLAVRFLLALPLVLAGMLAAHSIVPALAGLFTEPTGERLVILGQAEQLAGLSIPFVALSLLIAAIDIGAERAVVLEDSPIGPALLQGLKALWHNFLDYIVPSRQLISPILSDNGCSTLMSYEPTTDHAPIWRSRVTVSA